MFQLTRVKPNDSGSSSSTLLSSPSRSECSPSSSHPPSPNSPNQLLPTINSTNSNQSSQRQSRKRIRVIPVHRVKPYKKRRIFNDKRSVSPLIDANSRSNLDIHQNPNDNSNNKKSIQNPSCTTEDKSHLCSSHTDCLSSLNTLEAVTLAKSKAHIENNVDDLMNELQTSFNITRMVFNNHRSFVQSKLNQMTQQCEQLSISLNKS